MSNERLKLLRNPKSIHDLLATWIREKKFGNIVFKGSLIIDGKESPVDIQFNFWKGNIQNIKLTETVELSKR